MQVNLANALTSSRNAAPEEDREKVVKMKTLEGSLPEELAVHLLGDEQIIWWGRPNQGVKLGSRDLLLVPFSCLWCGIAIFWEITVWRGKAPLAFLMFGGAFVSVGLFLVFGRFLVDSWIRRHIWYALTDRRALIARSGRWPAFTSLHLVSLPETRLRLHSNGTGTIRFGQKATIFGRTNTGVWINALDPTPQFIAIGDAERVFAVVQTGAQSNPCSANARQRTSLGYCDVTAGS